MFWGAFSWYFIWQSKSFGVKCFTQISESSTSDISLSQELVSNIVRKLCVSRNGVTRAIYSPVCSLISLFSILLYAVFRYQSWLRYWQMILSVSFFWKAEILLGGGQNTPLRTILWLSFSHREIDIQLLFKIK